MLSRVAKSWYFALAQPLMWLSGRIYRRFRAPSGGSPRVQLGPGQKNYLPGWINLDANMFTGKCDVWVDLRHPLPFRSGSIAAFYSHHVVEHLPELRRHFAEVFRCLAPGGVYRVGVPNGDMAIAKFSRGDLEWFSTFPEHRHSIGGRLDNFLLCRNEHLSILTYSYLEELMRAAGFADLRCCRPGIETGYPHLLGECLSLEPESCPDEPHTLIVEGRKRVGGGS